MTRRTVQGPAGLGAKLAVLIAGEAVVVGEPDSCPFYRLKMDRHFRIICNGRGTFSLKLRKSACISVHPKISAFKFFFAAPNSV
jgi:hypothetical protein